MHPVSKALFNVLQSWRDFRDTHNLDDPTVKCCEKSQALFIALELFDEAVQEDIASTRQQGDDK